MTNADFLRRLPLFAELPDADLEALCGRAATRALAPGEWLMREGEQGDSLYVVLEGQLEILKQAGDRDVALAVRGPGDFLGEMALLEQAPRSASVRAVEAGRVLTIGRDAFQQLLGANPSMALVLLRTVHARLKSTEALLGQTQKLAALGTLAAGLAHELNNPAAAVRRSAAQLRDVLDDWQRLASRLSPLLRSERETQRLEALRAEIRSAAAAPPALEALARGDLEAELHTWLEAHGVAEAWEAAPNLAALGWSPERLEGLTSSFSSAALPGLVGWMSAGFTVFSLLTELAAGAERLSEIVNAVKDYTYLDQAPVQVVDVHAGLENTLVILRHKLKHGVDVRRQYAAGLPPIEAYGSELNQVWTNLIDNAVDAMNGQGQLTLTTAARGDQVLVAIADTGPGIPPELQGRLFDPFFTTKPPGQGTGLGLHIAHNIIGRHRGQIRLASRPGRTEFQVTLPIHLQRGPHE